MKPIVKQKTINEYVCPKCSKHSEYERDILKCIHTHNSESLKKQCDAWGSQATFKTEDQADQFVKMKVSELNESSFIPCTVTDTFTGAIDWQGPGVYTYHTSCTREGYDYKEYEVRFKKRDRLY